MSGHTPSKPVAYRWIYPDEVRWNIGFHGPLDSTRRAIKVEPLYSHAANEAKIEALTSALLRIAFNEDVNSLSANPTKWPSEIAYVALGGRVQDGQRADDRAALTSAGEK